MRKKKSLTLVVLLAGSVSASAQHDPVASVTKIPEWLPQVHGTVRSKFEFQTHEGEQRFELRNARLSVDGNATRALRYKAEVDLSDEGSFKVLDVYGELLPLALSASASPTSTLALRMGQCRVPFAIEPHRSPHARLFANRSFLAKQIGSVRDVGGMVSYECNYGVKKKGLLSIKAGIFNGSGLESQKNYWTKTINYSARLLLTTPSGFTLSGSTMRNVLYRDGKNSSTHSVGVYLYDATASLQRGSLFVEAEYMRKHYAHNAFRSVSAFQALATYDIALTRDQTESRALFDRMSLRARYDYMGDHSDGKVWTLDANKQPQLPALTDVERSRITGGVTFRFAKSVAKNTTAELRLNYEKYFYNSSQEALIKPSERDKAVVELMVRF